MWCRVDPVKLTDVSEERIASIFRVEKSTSEEPAWADVCRLLLPAYAGSSLADFSYLKMETRSSETSVHFTGSTRHHIPEDGILHSHRCENLKSYEEILICNIFTIARSNNFISTRIRS
jgi:hypothetical protein